MVCIDPYHVVDKSLALDYTSNPGLASPVSEPGVCGLQAFFILLASSIISDVRGADWSCVPGASDSSDDESKGSKVFFVRDSMEVSESSFDSSSELGRTTSSSSSSPSCSYEELGPDDMSIGYLELSRFASNSIRFFRTSSAIFAFLVASDSSSSSSEPDVDAPSSSGKCSTFSDSINRSPVDLLSSSLGSSVLSPED